jgi:hypothetical protein
MMVVEGRGTQGDLEAPQPPPQLPILLLSETIHRQQVEASSAVWGNKAKVRLPPPCFPAQTTFQTPVLLLFVWGGSW